MQERTNEHSGKRIQLYGHPSLHCFRAGVAGCIDRGKSFDYPVHYMPLLQVDDGQVQGKRTSVLKCVEWILVVIKRHNRELSDESRF